MPNWCENELRIHGSKKERERLKDFIRYTVREKLDGREVNNRRSIVELFEFNNVIPYPEEFKVQDGWAREEQEKLRNMSKFEHDAYIAANGYPKDGYNAGGYGWCCANWGTKWGAKDTELKEGTFSTLITFSTAWAPSLPISLKLSQLFPRLKFSHSYWECGAAYKGKGVFKNGECILDQDSDYSGGRGG